MPAPRPARDDLTARARIRDAALALFAERGFAGASIRDIAEAAGVSPGLVQHHYRSKEALRDACDEYAVATFRQTKEDSLRVENVSSPLFVAAAYEHTLPALRYLARALAEGTPGAVRLFDEFVDLFEQQLLGGEAASPQVEVRDPRAFVAVLTAQTLGLLVLNEHVARVLGVDVLTREGHPRAARAMVDIHSQSLVSPELAEATHRALDRLEAEEKGAHASPTADRAPPGSVTAERLRTTPDRVVPD